MEDMPICKVPSSWAIRTPDSISDKEIMAYEQLVLTAALIFKNS